MTNSRIITFTSEELASMDRLERDLFHEECNDAKRGIPDINSNTLTEDLLAVLEKHAPTEKVLWGTAYIEDRLVMHEALKALFTWLEAR